MTPTTSETETASRPAAVYRLYDADGTLLYIGSTYDPAKRFRAHQTKPWWPLVAEKRVEWHPSKEAAYAVEMAAIAAEAPAHNEMGTPRYVPPAAKAAARREPSSDLTVAEIAKQYGVSRTLLHTYRTRGIFPQPVPAVGSTRLRFNAREVAAFFKAHPKRQGYRPKKSKPDEESST